MDSGNPYALAARKRDILLTLKSNEVYYPDSIAVSELQAMLPNGGDKAIENAIDELATKKESPLRYYPHNQQRVYLSGKKSTESYISLLRSKSATNTGTWFHD